MSKPGRNDPCPCGSGKKFKKCCGLGVQKKKLNASVISSGANPLGSRIGSLTSRISKTASSEVTSETLEKMKTKPDESNNT